jgi:hypothetical protein
MRAQYRDGGFMASPNAGGSAEEKMVDAEFEEVDEPRRQQR